MVVATRNCPEEQRNKRASTWNFWAYSNFGKSLFKKKKNNNSKEGAFKIQGKKCTTLTIHKWKSDFDTNQDFNNLTACYQNTAYSASL